MSWNAFVEGFNGSALPFRPQGEQVRHVIKFLSKTNILSPFDKRYLANQITVRLGEHHLYRDDDFSKPIELKALEVKQHSKFQRHGFFNDIGLIRLKEKVRFSSDISPICLPTIKERTKNLIGYMATVCNLFDF